MGEEETHRRRVLARSLWLGLAAAAAFARGDRLGVVRLRRAANAVRGGVPPDHHVVAIRAACDDELAAMLDAAGVPRGPA